MKNFIVVLSMVFLPINWGAVAYAYTCTSSYVEDIIWGKQMVITPSPTTNNPWDLPVPINGLVTLKSKQKPVQRGSYIKIKNAFAATDLHNGIDYEIVKLTTNATLDGCTASPADLSKLWIKRVDVSPTDGAILIVGGLAPDGVDINISCTTREGKVLPKPVSAVYKVTTIFGSQVINSSTRNFTLKLMARPVQCEIGKTGSFYLAASYQDQFFFYSNSTKTWKAWHSGEPMPIWFTTTIQKFDTEKALANINISDLAGVQFFMGYGLDEANMIKYGQVKLVYPLR